MNESVPAPTTDVAAKIAALVKEKGWNQEDFARIADLNRQTVRQILQPSGNRRLRYRTIGNCARALGLSVHELLNQSLDRLLARVHSKPPPPPEDKLRRLYEQASQPELREWMSRNPERGQQLTAEDVDESLLSLQGTGGPLTAFGVEHFVSQLERRRNLLNQVSLLANTEYLDLLEKLVGLMVEKIQPYRDRS